MDYLSIRELAEATGYTRQHIHRLVKKGTIVAEKISERRIAIPISEANKLIDSAKSECAAYLRLNIDFSKVNEKFIKDFVQQSRSISLCSDGDLKLFNLYILAKSFRIHSAIIALCRQGQGESALTLVRQLIEADASLRWIYKEKTEERIKKFVSQVIPQKMRSLKQAYQDEKMRLYIVERRNNPEPYDLDISDLKKMKKKLGLNTNSGQFWHGLGSLEELIREAGLPEHYNIYLSILNSSVHINPVDVDHYVSLDDDELLLILGVGPESVKDALMFGFHFAFSIVDFMNDHEKIGYESSLSKLAKAYEQTGEIETEAVVMSN